MDNDRKRDNTSEPDFEIASDASAGSGKKKESEGVADVDDKPRQMFERLATLDEEYSSENRRRPLQTLAPASIHESESSDDAVEDSGIRIQSNAGGFQQSYTTGGEYSSEVSQGKKAMYRHKEMDEHELDDHDLSDDDILADIELEDVKIVSMDDVTKASQQRRKKRGTDKGRHGDEFDEHAEKLRTYPYVEKGNP